MVGRVRYSVAYALLAVSAIAIAAGTVWYYAGTSRSVTAAAASAPATATGARLAADAFVGAVKSADADGVCALLADEVRSRHPHCRAWAKSFIGATSEGSYLVVAVVMRPKQQARVRVVIDGDHYFWFFVREHAAWRFSRVTAVPFH